MKKGRIKKVEKWGGTAVTFDTYRDRPYKFININDGKFVEAIFVFYRRTETVHMRKEVFDNWNNLKKKINNESGPRSFHEREVWFVSLGQNIGHEQAGKGEAFMRPVIILKKFSKRTFLGIPLSRTHKDNRFSHPFFFKEGTSTALLSQVRLLDARRLGYYSGRVSRGDFNKVKEKLIELIR